MAPDPKLIGYSLDAEDNLTPPHNVTENEGEKDDRRNGFYDLPRDYVRCRCSVCAMTYEEERDKKYKDRMTKTDAICDCANSFKAGADWAIRESSLVRNLVTALKSCHYYLQFNCDSGSTAAEELSENALAQYAAEINRK